MSDHSRPILPSSRRASRLVVFSPRRSNRVALPAILKAREASPLTEASLQAERKPAAPTAPGGVGRCTIKGCVFPGPSEVHGPCSYHRRQNLEPSLFESLQPSTLLLGRAVFGVPDSEPDDSRVRDRRRQAMERRAFLLEEAA